MVRGARELIAGRAHDDPQFGPCVMVGLGGVLAEAVGDVAFRLVPLDAGRRRRDARRAREPRRSRARSGASRRSTATRVADVAARPVARSPSASRRRRGRREPADRRRRPPDRGRRARRGRARDRDAHRTRLRERCSSRAAWWSRARRRHPGKFGFVALHNILRHGYAGEVFATNREGGEILGRRRRARRSTTCPTAPPTSSSCARRRRRTSSSCAPARPRGCGPRSSPRRATAKPATRAAGPKRELVALADELGMLARRPERPGRGVDPGSLCAQIVAPYPPPGADRDREPVGQLRVVVPELRGPDRRRRQPRRLGRATRPRVTVPDFLEYYADDPETVGRARVRRGRRRRAGLLRPGPDGRRTQAVWCC